MTAKNIRVVVFKDGDAWVAHCVEFDIAAQASDLASLKRRLQATIELDLKVSMDRSGVPFGGIGRAPQYIEEMWDSMPMAFKESAKAKTDGRVPATVDYEMALCA